VATIVKDFTFVESVKFIDIVQCTASLGIMCEYVPPVGVFTQREGEFQIVLSAKGTREHGQRKHNVLVVNT